MTRWLAPLALLCAVAAQPAPAQGTRADYDRAEKLPELTRNKLFRARVEPRWIAGGPRFWYRIDTGPGQWEFLLVDPDKATRAPAFDHDQLAAALGRATGDNPPPARSLPVENLDFAPAGDTITFRSKGKWWTGDLATYTLAETKAPQTRPAPPNSGDPRRGGRRFGGGGGGGRDQSPDGQWTAFIKNHNVHLRPYLFGESIPLSTDGTPDDPYEPRFYWSPDSKKLAALRTKKGEERLVYLIESSPRDQLQPKLHSFSYNKPGDKLPIAKPHLFDVEAKKPIPVKDDLFPHAWSVTDLRWDKDSGRFTFLYNQRGHQVMRVVAVDAKTGETKSVVNEEVKTFFDYTNKLFKYDLPDKNELIWMSERDGWNHLYLYDATTGQVKKQITKGEWVVRRVERVDPDKRQILMRVSGHIPGQDPYHVHFARINFDGTGLTLLTEGDGTHEITWSPDGAYLLDTYSRVDLPPVTELRRAADGKLVYTLERADATALLAAGVKPPERFVAKGRDGTTDIYGVIHRPTNFDPDRKYPVIEDIYAGPQGSFVPKSFFPLHRQQSLCELGFIVVQIDGMGTNNRSKAFHDVCHKNLADAGLPDRVLWIKAAAAKYPQLDLSRGVGVYGTSAGGQSALGAVLTHGDFYTAAAADCGCHDNRVDKVWWNEQWMGWPIGPHYAEQSNVTLAPNLKGKLLLIVGELDRNVDPASTMQVVNALVKADKDFDLLVVPGGGHGGGGKYTWRRKQDFFVRNLLKVEPRS